jgi:hypothetical protein
MPTRANTSNALCPYYQDSADRFIGCHAPEEFATKEEPYFCPCAVADYDKTKFESAVVPRDEQKWYCGLVKR